MAKKLSGSYELDGIEFHIDYEMGTVTIDEPLYSGKSGEKIAGAEHDPRWLYSISKTLEDIARFVENEVQGA